MMICQRCREPLRFEAGRGWLHPNGQLVITKSALCSKCQGSSYQGEDDCPRCGGTGFVQVDDHCAQPIPKEAA
jgi:DnaJ-class molecular chaperone